MKKIENKDNRRIFSFNKLAYLIKHGVQLELHQQIIDGKIVYYGIANQDVGDLIRQYYEDVELHKFLNAFGQVRKGFKELEI